MLYKRAAVLLCLFALMTSAVSAEIPGKSYHSEREALVQLRGHVLPLLGRASVVSPKPGAADQLITLTIVLKRDDEAGFERYLRGLYSPHSKNFHHFLTQDQATGRFGPSRGDYDLVLNYLLGSGFKHVDSSRNPLTITVRGTRTAIEQAFHTKIRDYRIASQTFRANASDPQLPVRIASRIENVSGLSDLSQPHHAFEAIDRLFCSAECRTSLEVTCASKCNSLYGGVPDSQACKDCLSADQTACINKCVANKKKARAGNSSATDPGSWLGMNGSGQTVGLVEFDTYNPADVAAFVSLAASDANAANVSEVKVDGGATLGAGEEEVLLDIDAILSIATGAKVVVYDAPFAGAASFQTVFSAAINGGSTIISNSWTACEDQVSAADAQGIDSLFQTAAVQGITIINAAGDSGSTCLDGSPNTIGVPADSPNGTAVGGSSLTYGPTYIYGTETWWDGTTNTPPTGQGGFGFSKYFPRPSYQAGLNLNPSRSIPDVVDNADPETGVAICQADAGGCPTGLLYGGTSVAAPQWAAYVAILNQALGHNLGFLNPAIYPLGGTDAFHTAISMNSDFMHVGLGSPNLDVMHLRLNGITAGAPDAGVSDIQLGVGNPEFPAIPGVYADGTSTLSVVVTLRDSDGNSVSGKTVTLAANGGSSANITPSSAVTNVANGSAVFTVTDNTPENLTFTANDTSDGITITQQPVATFQIPPASSAAISAAPTSVTNDGISTTTISISLQDAQGHPTAGKQIQLSQGAGHSVITGPNPPLTNSSGVIQFTAVDQVSESITYTAIDVTDGNVQVPGSAAVTFSGNPGNGCGNGTPTVAPGFILTPYATGFLAQTYSFGNINFGCAGAFGMAFDGSGNLFVTDSPNGNIYKFPPGGGVAGNSTLIGTIGPTIGALTFDKAGNLFVSRSATTGNFTTGAVFQISPANGSILNTVASNLTCPGSALAVDPLTGDLFTDDSCSGAGSDNASIWRISNPDASPVTSVYATMPGTPNATLSFAPSGTMYAWAFTALNGSGIPTLAQISGTNRSSPPSISLFPNLQLNALGLLADGQQANGNAQTVFLNPFNTTTNQPVGITGLDLTTNPPGTSVMLVQNTEAAANMIFGPGGCIFVAQPDSVYKITDSAGGCNYAAPNQSATLSLSPVGVSPNPAQGTSQTFTASFHYTNVPDGTPVLVTVSGANPQVLQGTTSSGTATVTYTGRFQGVDTLSASANLGTSHLTSNNSVLTWGPGSDVTFLSLNQSPTSATQGQTVNLLANLTDVSVTPTAPIASQNVSFDLGGTGCSATTDSNGNATCQVAAPGSSSSITLISKFNGTAQFNASSNSQSFQVLAPTPTPSPVGPTPTPTATPIGPTATPTATSAPTVTPTPVPTPGGMATLQGQSDSTGKAGATVNLGSFSYASTDAAEQSISSVSVSVSNPKIFSSLTLTVTAGGTTVGTSTADGSALASTTNFAFSPPIDVPAGSESLTFALSGVISGGSSASLELRGGVAMAGIIEPDWQHIPGAILVLAMGLIGLCLIPMTQRNRRRASILVAAALLLGVSAAGCNGSSGGSTSHKSSRQQVVSMNVTEGSSSVAVSGLPIDLGSIRKE